jgi:hypothetical protein
VTTSPPPFTPTIITTLTVLTTNTTATLKADVVLSEHANRDAGFEKEVRIQKKLDELKKLGGSKPMHDWDKRMNEERQKVRG